MGPSITVLSQVLSDLVLIMIGNAIVKNVLGWLYENPLIRAKTLNSAHDIDLMGKKSYFCLLIHKVLPVSS